MNYKNLLYILSFLIFSNCTTITVSDKKINYDTYNTYSNKGFALIYNDNLFKKNIISRKLDGRSLNIFQKNLKKNTIVKITNIINQKTIIANVSSKASYPLFNNSVISSRIASELELNLEEPYIEIVSVPENSMFIAKKTKTFDEEKNVANKVPVAGISINNLKVENENVKKKEINNFSYIIKIADFYYNKTALSMLDRIKNETKIKNPKIMKLSAKKYRVYLGPFNNISSLQKSFNDISILNFENIEISKL